MSLFFMDIPIYRCTLSQYETENDRLVAKNSKGLTIPELRAEEERFFRIAVPSWDFSETVGWIRLSAISEGIMGQLFWVGQKRLFRGMRKGFRRREVVIDLTVKADETSEAIFQELTGCLEKLNKEPRFKKRYIDLRALQSVGPYVDWRTLVESGEQ